MHALCIQQEYTQVDVHTVTHSVSLIASVTDDRIVSVVLLKENEISITMQGHFIPPCQVATLIIAGMHAIITSNSPQPGFGHRTGW